MEKSIFKYILRYSKSQQIFLLCVILAFYPFLFITLDLPKIIVNRAIKSGGAEGPFDVPIFGFEISLDVEQITYLLILSFSYLGLVFITGGFKYYISVYKGRLGERLLRRLRYQLYSRILRFPTPHFKKISQGELIPMITAEVEPLGGFIGIAFADPMFFGGQLVLILGYILLQDWALGLAAAALIPVQGYVIPRLQKKVNALGKQRVQNVRRLADHLGESVSSINEIHSNDAAKLEMSRFADRLGTIYDIRYDIYRRKFFIKFLNNFIDKLTPFFFFSIGGYLVIQGGLTVGALVAVLNAYKDLASPWKELLMWYQQKEDVRIKYEQVVEQFEPQGMLEEELQHTETEGPSPIKGDLIVSNIGLADEDGVRSLEGISFDAPVVAHVAVVGDGGSGKTDLGLVLSRLVRQTSGTITIGGVDLTQMPEAITGRRIAYVGSNAYLQAFSVGDNLLYGLKHKPIQPAEYEGAEDGKNKEKMAEARITGNSENDYLADWVDLQEAGVEDREALNRRLIETLTLADMDDDVYRFGLRGVIDPEKHPEVASRIMAARQAMRERFTDPAVAQLIEPFSADAYNTNASVAENILFGLPVGDAFDLERLAEHPYIRDVLDKVGLTDDFLEMGKQVAQTMLELFADLPPGHEFFEQFSFIESDDLPEFQIILGRASRGPEGLTDDDRLQLISLPFKLIRARHRLDLVDDQMMQRILEARHTFAENLPEDLRDNVAFFDSETYNAAASLQDNILFGKLSYGQAQAENKVGALVGEVVDDLDLRETVMLTGLDFQAGIGGARLSQGQRQKVVIARSLLRQPDLLILNEATATLDAVSQNRIMENILRVRRDQGVVWILNRVPDAQQFSKVVVLKSGRVLETGTYDELITAGGEFQTLLEAG
ncbi:MAG: ATP-binding cassette domain-containing protein [Alphaproteobacteria bacterium]|nr:ATP-binding cassette domain-containing protein [Alphaproteobacteria bacterium]